MTDLIKGVDISTIQGNVDFKALAASGVQFVICRCGVGNNGVDNLYKQNVANAKAAGLKVMAYHFVFPLPTIPSQPLRDPKAQAQMHVSAACGELAACDLEWPEQQDWSKWGCSAPQIVRWAIDYLAAYEQLSGIRPIVYTFPNFAECINLPTEFGQQYKLWIASYEPTPFIPKPWTDWVIWQDSGGTSHLPNGVPVDTDKAKDLSLWDAQPAAAPAPAFPAVQAPVTPDPILVPIPEPAPAPVAPAPAPIVPVQPQANLWSLIVQVVRALFAKYFKK
jgi:GH25 family lysozyme M1 (1,4-beta-N-acetylmuramidase)